VQLLEDGSLQGTIGIDLRRPGLAWERDDYWAMGGLEGNLGGVGTGAGEDDRLSLIGVGLADGEEVWREAMSGELRALQPNGRWALVEDRERRRRAHPTGRTEQRDGLPAGRGRYAALVTGGTEMDVHLARTPRTPNPEP
jgi:hypothetical protein